MLQKVGRLLSRVAEETIITDEYMVVCDEASLADGGHTERPEDV